MIAQITANELKIKGITAIDELVPENEGVIITVRGKEKYVVLSIEEYNQFRELELDAAIKEARENIGKGKAYSDGIKSHINRVANV